MALHPGYFFRYGLIVALILFFFPHPGFTREQGFSANQSKKQEVRHVPIGKVAKSAKDGLSVTLVARFQHYNSNPTDPADHYDKHIFSPKSVLTSAFSGQVFVNSLEGLATVVYDPETLKKKGVILHRFIKKKDHLFIDASEQDSWWSLSDIEKPNTFWGKPVEFAETHGGRYLWSSYYRRSYDKNATLPSAVAVIDTQKNEIIRVMSTATLPKTLASSPDGKWLASIHWGDNTVGFIDVSADDPKKFSHSGLVTIEKKYQLESDGPVDRDKSCGFCLRGAVFSPDSRYLLVGRMKGGGIALIDVERQRYLGTVYGMKPTPRHLVLSPDGETLYLSSNISGYVSSYRLNDLIEAVISGKKRLKPLWEVRTGVGTRTIDLTPDGRYIFGAIKYASSVAVVDVHEKRLVMSIPTDSYPVGLNVSPEGRQLWVTSQGAKGLGGNSVTVYQISRE